MGKCVVPGCSMHTDRDLANGVRFFPIPAIRQTGPPGYRNRSALRRRAWLLVINNADLMNEYEKTTRRICSRHFVSGQPSAPNDEKNCDWLPSLHVGENTEPDLGRVKVEEPITEPLLTSEIDLGFLIIKAEPGIKQPIVKVEPVEHQPIGNVIASTASFNTGKEEGSVDVTVPQNVLDVDMGCDEESLPPGNDMVTVRCDDYNMMEEELQSLRNENADLKKSYTKLRNQLTEADVDKLELNAELAELRRTCDKHIVRSRALEEENASLREKVDSLENTIKKLQEEVGNKKNEIATLEYSLFRAKRTSISLEIMKEDNDFVNFYTGLPCYNAFELCLNHVGSRVTEPRCVLAPWQCLLLTLMRLKLSLTLQDLSYRFAISRSTACSIFERWLHHLYQSLDSFIVWPDREVIQRTMSDSFKETFSDNVVVILYCFEIFPETRAGRQPNAKHRNSVKYFTGLTPSGAISFVSHGWDAKDSVINVLAESGFYKRLLTEDEIVTDHRLPSGENTGWCCAKVLDSNSTDGKLKLRCKDIKETRKLSLLKLHVEKISSLRKKYRIFRGDLPLQDAHKRSVQQIPQIDQIVRVCCALTNISESTL